MLKNKYKKNQACRAPKSSGLKFLNGFIWLMVLGMVLGYAIYANNLTVQEVQVKELKQEAGTLQDENREVQSKITKLKSYQRISQKVEDLNLVNVDNIDYITATQDVIAKK